VTLEDYPLHDSIRGWFGRELYFQMKRNPDIILITADLGYGLFDRHRDDMPEQFYNVGASEQLAVGIAVGLALEGKIPFVYSITSFLMFRSFEWIRNYVNYENIPVRLVGSGMDKDYAHDGITHQPSLRELNLCFAVFQNIETYMPKDKENVPTMVDKMVMRDQPSFICLRR